MQESEGGAEERLQISGVPGRLIVRGYHRNDDVAAAGHLFGLVLVDYVGLTYLTSY